MSHNARQLTGEDAAREFELERQIDVAMKDDSNDEATSPLEQLPILRALAQGAGADHWEAVNLTWQLDCARKEAALPTDERAGWRKAQQGASAAHELHEQGRYAQAEPHWHEYRRWCERVFGDQHPATAGSYNNLAMNLNAQGKYAEAQPLFQKALDLRRDLLGVRHPETANSYDNLAFNLHAQGKYAEAQPLHQTALDLRHELLGENHPDTARSYNNLAANLRAQGKYAEALPLFQRVLDLCRESLGERHPNTAATYENLASNLNAQGKYAEALPLYQKALDLHRELFGERHPATAGSYNNLAYNLNAQGKYAEAQPLFQKALDMTRELLGERHPQTAMSYGNLAGNLSDQRKYAEALPLFQKALDVDRELLGEQHPATAGSYNNLAMNLDAQGKYAEALSLFQKALDMTRELLGERHPRTAMSYDNLAGNLRAQGKYAEALPLFQKALVLRRELLGEHHPATAVSYNNLASNLHAQGKYAEALPLLISATVSYEAARLSVAWRGLDRAMFGLEWSPYQLLAATQAHFGHRAAAWLAAERDLSRGLSDEAAARNQLFLTAEEQTRQSELTSHLQQIQPRILQLVTQQSTTEAEQDELFQLKEEQRALEAELSGLAITVNQRELASLEQVQAALPADAALVLWIDLVARAAQVGEHLACVVRPAGEPRWEVLSGSGPAGTWTNTDAGLARRFQAAVASQAPATEVAELAARFYAQRFRQLEHHLEGVRRLYVVPVDVMAGIPADVVTDKYLVSYVPSGAFLARLKDRPRPGGTALLALGDPAFPDATPSVGSPWSLATRGDWSELPGTSVEVARLEALVGDDQTTVLTRSDASEQALEQLRADGKLKDFRYLHFATHGEPNNARSFESALILAQDQITGDITKGGGKYYDGRLTANEVLENWELNADLVTLSACESALGRPGGGDGQLGFAQAFLLAGARSVCLSLWKVDDTATALLMDRFYQNLLGKREGLEQPMPKAEALAEAKQWLRNLTLDEATQLAADLSQGVSRGKNEPALALAVPSADAQPTTETDDRPFAHSRYWAAFILIGDPD